MYSRTLLLTLLAGVFSSSLLFGQSSRSSSLRAELDSEVETLYAQAGGARQDEQAAKRIQARQLPAKQAAPVVVSAPPSVPMEAYVEQRPTVYVESSPLDESKASRMRKQREAVEAETEMRIVEKLEQDRMESERERAQRLFGEKWDKQQTQIPQHNQNLAPVVVGPSAAEQELEKEDFKQDLREIVTELRAEEKEVDAPPVTGEQYYLLLQGGAGVYPGVENVRGAYNLGVHFGIDYVYGLMVEAGLSFSNYDMYECAGYNGGCNYSPLNANLREIRQTNVGLALKYKFNSSSRIKPVVGGVASIAFREYELMNGNGYNAVSAKSQALDLGVVGGVDVELGPRLAIGADIRYMFNITNRVDGANFGANNFNAFSANSSPIEELQYYLFNVNMRVSF